MGQMRGLFLIALGVFVLYLLITGRLYRVPAAWSVIADGTVPDASGVAGVAGAGSSGGIGAALGKLGGIITGSVTGTMSPAQAAAVGSQVFGGGTWPAQGGRTSSATVTDAPPMTRPPAARPTPPIAATPNTPAAPTAATQAAATVSAARRAMCAAFPIPGVCP